MTTLQDAMDLAAQESYLAVVPTTRLDGSVQASVVNAGMIAHRAGKPAEFRRQWIRVRATVKSQGKEKSEYDRRQTRRRRHRLRIDRLKNLRPKSKFLRALQMLKLPLKDRHDADQ